MGDALMDFGATVTDVLRSFTGFWMLVTFQGIDIVSGCAVAAGKGKWNSSIGRKGLSRKVGMLCLFGCAVAIEHWVPGAPPMSGIAALFLSWGEIQSIIENADDLGIPLPASVTRWMRERRKLTERQLDKAIKGGINVEFMEMTTRNIDQHAEHVHQNTAVAEVKADSVVLKSKDSSPVTNVIRE